MRIFRPASIVLAAGLLVWTWVAPARAADENFTRFVASLWPQAQKMGVSHATFDAATRGLEPDLSLPDLVLPGQAQKPQPGQAEFVQAPADYVRESSIARLAAQGRQLLEKHRAALAGIEKEFGVPPQIILAIWGRETAFGSHKLPHNAFRVLATQAYLGRRKEQFREEFLYALKIVEDGVTRVDEMRSSWAGAMGLTQFLPSEYYKHGVDFDRDGKTDIWHSVPDALASAAKQLVNKGWQAGQRWAYEVRVPQGLDCTVANPEAKMRIGDWVARGFMPAYGRTLGPAERALEASLLMAAGLYGPAFLVPKNYFVIKEYNFSDLYVLFVGHLADRISDPRPFETPWAKVTQLETTQVESMQRRLTELGYYNEKIDGKAGMKTRLALGAYQKANGLKLDCWPTASVLEHMRR